MRFRKKPVVIEAIQFDGKNGREICDWVGDVDPKGITTEMSLESLTIVTLEGRMKADVNDWIIKGVKGEFYPCKPDIFEATYDLVVEGEEVVSSNVSS